MLAGLAGPVQSGMTYQGIVLFAHGARDPRWADPFAAVVARIRADRPGLPVLLAFLEHLQPDLNTALRDLASRGVSKVRVVPLFFGRGGHLRDDLPKLLERARGELPQLEVELAEAAGEDVSVQAALAAFALRSAETTRVPSGNDLI
jgi:sirohydrochlorin cobaltochelatase